MANSADDDDDDGKSMSEGFGVFLNEGGRWGKKRLIGR